MEIGFVGLGNMGAPMAQNLATAGYSVTGFDLATAAPEGVQQAQSLIDLATTSSVIMTMLPDGAALQAVIEAALPQVKADTLFIDSSTVDVATARTVASSIQENGHLAIDAPVSGGTGGATNGTLTFMVGGPQAAVDRAAPLLKVMGAKTFHCGENGAGQAAKICNNMILGISMIATCEAFALADGLGLDRQALFDVVSASSGQSWSMTTYCPAPGIGPKSPADNNYHPGFATELMAKDLGLSQQAAIKSGVETPLGGQAQALYDAFLAKGGAGRDFSAMLDHLKNQ